MPVAVNISPRNLLDVDFPNQVKGLLDAWGLEPDVLQLEITEGAVLADPVRTKGVLEALAEMGIRLAIDDFGTGYSSLAYLNRLPVHQLKIDKTFVGAMTTSASAEIIVRSTVELAHNLGLEVVAEGVESEATLERLAELQCDYAQGYHFSRPVLGGRLSGRIPAGNEFSPATTARQ